MGRDLDPVKKELAALEYELSAITLEIILLLPTIPVVHGFVTM